MIESEKGVKFNILIRNTQFMARHLRLKFAGALYHVTSRGDICEDIYLDDYGGEELLKLLER
jgi:hypothetical protein